MKLHKHQGIQYEEGIWTVYGFSHHLEMVYYSRVCGSLAWRCCCMEFLKEFLTITFLYFYVECCGAWCVDSGPLFTDESHSALNWI